ncbi:hypothetical protein [Pseudoxanthomonas wuyuanensis]|uniref:hypothetical protein n=1 Tax=Pseudoxanthomonas wuyuanensis TaxID=1073196 RepID=UPI001EE3F688|nr:hypothetical protein [Pseudoxanthomonas wuyuanensis]
MSVLRSSRWLTPLILLLGGLCFSLIWILLALHLDRQAGWMALLAALDAALILRFTGMRRGPARILLAVTATVLMIALALWGIVASQLGFMLGLSPWSSAAKLGLAHAWTLLGLANTPADLICMAAAPLLAAFAAR